MDGSMMNEQFHSRVCILLRIFKAGGKEFCKRFLFYFDVFSCCLLYIKKMPDE
jgi:hypothetical protein